MNLPEQFAHECAKLGIKNAYYTYTYRYETSENAFHSFYFDSEEDINLYRLLGHYKETEYLKFRVRNKNVRRL